MAAPVQAQVGLAGGLDFSRLDDIEAANASATLDRSTGYHLGIFFDAELGALSIRPGVYYHDIGRYEFGDFGDGVDPDETVSVDLSAVEFPIDVRLRLLPDAAATPYLLAAPVFTFPRSEDDFDGTRNFNLTADVGVGFEIEVQEMGLALLPEFRYGIGTTSFLEDSFEVGGTTVEPQDDPRLDAIMLRLNIRF